MNFTRFSESNYDKTPYISVSAYEKDCWEGWDSVISYLNRYSFALNKRKLVVVAEFYLGVSDIVFDKLKDKFQNDYWFSAADAMKSHVEIDKLIYPDVTDDELFGFMTSLEINDFFDKEKLLAMKTTISNIENGIVLVMGCGASLLADADLLLYFDMPRWEAQLRFRRNQVSNLGADNKYERASLQYKRAYFVDWRVCDRLKKRLMERWDFVIDTVDNDMPKMVSANLYFAALEKAVHQPFRVVPFFDPGPWGGQWMKEVCDLDKDVDNYAWCFDCVPEENSLLLKIGDMLFESPSINLVFWAPQALLGKEVFMKFGDEFPIRFDFLDTMQGGNLSLQVHPLTQYIKQKFGVQYTQDESYYILDAGDDACVFLGLKEDINPEKMIDALRLSQDTAIFDAELYVEKWKARRHDHFLIPAGTVHCSGANTMVLEISATPYIFTFKLWDWNRLGLDGRPRPINIEHGKQVIQWGRTTQWTKNNLINQITMVDKGDNWTEEKTGLHELEFIETRRHWFSDKITHYNDAGVNVLNLVEGSEVVVESPENLFQPFIVHYAETFIIPATIKKYTIKPIGRSEGKLCATIKAYVRNDN
jgi:mannose-6-phosphate isomerase class I/adenylate kinase family enzyme